MKYTNSTRVAQALKTTTFFWLFLSLFLMTTQSWAQGMDFSEEDVKKAEPDEGDGDGDGMDFDIDGDGKELGTLSDEGPQNVAIVALPGEFMNPELHARIQEELDRYAATVTNIKAVSGSAVQAEIEKRGGDECLNEPICLSEVGESVGVDRILSARVRKDDAGSLELATDYFDVEDHLYLNYDSVKGLSGDDAIVAAIEPSLKVLLDVRDLVATPDYVDDRGDGTFQTILAWSTGGLAIASLGAGIFFGLDAASQESDLEALPKSGDVFNITQKDAAVKIREAESTAVTANIFFGVAAGLAIASGILFYIQGGSDVATQEELDASLPSDFQFAPIITKHSVGFGAGFSF